MLTNAQNVYCLSTASCKETTILGVSNIYIASYPFDRHDDVFSDIPHNSTFIDSYGTKPSIGTFSSTYSYHSYKEVIHAHRC